MSALTRTILNGRRTSASLMQPTRSEGNMNGRTVLFKN